MTPIPQPIDDCGGREQWREIELSACKRCGETARPQHRVFHVPIIPPMEAVIRFGGAAGDLLGRMTEQARFQPMQHYLNIKQPGGGTRISWWSWEPVEEEAKRDVKRGLRRAFAMLERVRFLLVSRESFLFDFGRTVSELREWANIAIEDIEQALGKP